MKNTGFLRIAKLLTGIVALLAVLVMILIMAKIISG